MSQMMALTKVGASKVGFLTQLATIIVPLVAWFCSGIVPGLKQWFAAVLAIVGVGFLNYGGGGGILGGWRWGGEGLAVVSAGFSAGYIWRSGLYARKVGVWSLVVGKVWAQLVFSVVFLGVRVLWGGVRGGWGKVRGLLWRGGMGVGGGWWWWAVIGVLLFFAGVVSAVVSAWLQCKGQAVVGPSEAAVYFASTPLWILVMALPLGEKFGAVEAAGAGVILASTLLASGESGSKDKIKEA